MRDLRGLLAADIEAVVDLALNEPVAALTRELVYCRFPTMKLTRNFRVSPGTLFEQLDHYPGEVAGPLRSATDGECYRVARRAARRATARLHRFVTSDASLSAFLERFASLDQSAAPPVDLTEEEVERFGKELLAREAEVARRANEMAPHEYLGYLVRPRLAHLIQATLRTPAAAALASTLVALENLYIEIEAERVMRCLLRLQVRHLDDTGAAHPWPLPMSFVSACGPRVIGPLERASPAGLRRLALSLGRAAVSTLPRPIPTPIRRILRGCRRYLQDAPDQPLLALVHSYARRYESTLETRWRVAERNCRKRLGPEIRAALWRAELLLTVGFTLVVATEPDAYESVEFSYKYAISSFDDSVIVPRARQRCVGILRWAVGSE